MPSSRGPHFPVSRCLCRASPEVDTQEFIEDLVPFHLRPYDAQVRENKTPLRAICVGRHLFLAEHFARFFGVLGIETRPVVGILGAPIEAHDFDPDVVICEYELLVTLPLETIERDELLSRRPLIAVSLSRRPTEAHLLDVNGIGGFLYLPLLDPATAMRVISAAAASSRTRYDPAPATTSPLPALKS